MYLLNGNQAREATVDKKTKRHIEMIRLYQAATRSNPGNDISDMMAKEVNELAQWLGMSQAEALGMALVS